MRITSCSHNRFSEHWHKASGLTRRRDRRRNRSTPSDSLLTTLRDGYEEATHHVVAMPISISVPVERNLDVRPVHIIDRGKTMLACTT